MTHPARRVMPNGPVGRKLQRFKCMSKASAYAHICEVVAEYEPPAPPICLRGALKSCLGVYDYGWSKVTFVFKWPPFCSASTCGPFQVAPLLKGVARPLRAEPKAQSRSPHRSHRQPAPCCLGCSEGEGVQNTFRQEAKPPRMQAKDWLRGTRLDFWSR
jgi:hypothetical protein